MSVTNKRQLVDRAVLLLSYEEDDGVVEDDGDGEGDHQDAPEDAARGRQLAGPGGLAVTFSVIVVLSCQKSTFLPGSSSMDTWMSLRCHLRWQLKVLLCTDVVGQQVVGLHPPILDSDLGAKIGLLQVEAVLLPEHFQAPPRPESVLPPSPAAATPAPAPAGLSTVPALAIAV